MLSGSRVQRWGTPRAMHINGDIQRIILTLGGFWLSDVSRACPELVLFLRLLCRSPGISGLSCPMRPYGPALLGNVGSGRSFTRVEPSARGAAVQVRQTFPG